MTPRQVMYCEGQTMSNTSANLKEIYDALLRRYGPQGWWPADTTEEMIIGAILVQHATWKSVEAAISNLRVRGLLNLRAIADCADTSLVEVIRCAGTPMVKTRRLKAFASWLGRRYDFELEALLRLSKANLRAELLSIKGVGPETADCIALYAAGQPTFVVDAYTQRILVRHRVASPEWGYDRWKGFLESELASDTNMFKEYHALLVRVGKDHCRAKARCRGCPLEHLDHLIEPDCN